MANVAELLESAKRTSVRATNAIMTATYWEIGRRIVEFEQKGQRRAGYGEELLLRLSRDLSARFGRGFSRQNLQRFREFYLSFPPRSICPTVSSKSSLSIVQSPPAHFSIADLATRFPLPWSQYVLLLSLKNPEAIAFYESEALRGGWSVRQLNRQISTQFYERTMLSRNKAAMLTKGAKALPEDMVTPEEEIKDPFVLEFLFIPGLKPKIRKLSNLIFCYHAKRTGDLMVGMRAISA